MSRSTARTLVSSLEPWRSKKAMGCMRSTRKTSVRMVVRTLSSARMPRLTYTRPSSGSTVYMTAMKARSCARGTGCQAALLPHFVGAATRRGHPPRGVCARAWVRGTAAVLQASARALRSGAAWVRAGIFWVHAGVGRTQLRPDNS